MIPNRRPLLSLFLSFLLGILMAVMMLVSPDALQISAQGPGLPPYPPNPAPLTLLFADSVEVGVISRTQSTVRYLFLGNAGDSVTVEMTRTSDDLEPRLVLYDVNGNIVEEKGADLAGRKALMTVTLPERGWYVLEASSENNDTIGQYALKFSGAATDLYTLLPFGAPTIPGNFAILRGGEVPVTGNPALFLIPLGANQTVNAQLTAKGSSTLVLSKTDTTAPQSQVGTDSVQIQYPSTQAAWEWILITVITTDKDAKLSAKVVDASGNEVSLVPNNLLALATVTPTLTETFTLTPTVTLTRTRLPTRIPTERPPTAVPQAVLANGGVGLSNGARMNNGNFQVEGYCSRQGLGTRRDSNYWYCGSKRLGQGDFNTICRLTYKNNNAFARQDGSGSIPAFRWRCYVYK